jgi:hypothetical protein
MPNDAKLGLVVGVGLVIAVAVVFFQKEPDVTPAAKAATAAAPSPAGQLRTVKAKNTARTEENARPSTAAGEGRAQEGTPPAANGGQP